MAFIKGRPDTVTVPVKVEMYVDGKTRIVRFKATWKTLKRSELRELVQGIQEETVNDDTVLQDYLVGWEDLKGVNEELLPFSDEVLEEVMEEPSYVTALIASFNEAQGGGALAKN